MYVHGVQAHVLTDMMVCMRVGGFMLVYFIMHVIFPSTTAIIVYVTCANIITVILLTFSHSGVITLMFSNT